jgi:hypothetical protein
MTDNARHHSADAHEHDRGLTHNLRTMLSRRRALFVFGAAGASALAACSSAGSTTTAASASSEEAASSAVATDGNCVAAAPQETAGPYPGDGSNGPNVLIESGVVRQDIRSSFGSYSGTAEGVETTIELSLQNLANDCAAGTGMAVYLWHCDRDGEYSLYGRDITEQNYLRGVQVADSAGAAGRVRESLRLRHRVREEREQLVGRVSAIGQRLR